MSKEIIWQERRYDEKKAAQLCDELKISPLLSKILLARNVDEPSSVENFLSPRLKNLTDPSHFKDMDKAALRIASTILAGDTIGIFGDYDVDGVCSTAILQQFLLSINANVVVTLPNRMTEGYGLSRAGIDRLKERGARLLITADCGILAHNEIDYANSLDLEVIVVDHHNVAETLPNAFAVINPKRKDCPSKADYLCAAGVAFFLCIALRAHLRAHNYFLKKHEPDLRVLLDLVALATVCDVVPLIHDNRCLVKAGLKILKAGERVGLKALMDACGVDKNKISSTNLGFHLGPRINAAGRLEDATIALSLMNCLDEDQAKKDAARLNDTNQERRAIEDETLEKVCALIDDDPQKDRLPIFVIHDESFHIGVVGIVASRVAERYHRPAIIIGKKGKGSGRSIKGIDLHEMVTKASSSLAGFGGHAHAIGVTLSDAGADVFRRDLIAVMEQEVSRSVFTKEIIYDAVVAIDEINLSVVDELLKLDPFGASNPNPVVRINHCTMRNLRRLSGGHLKGELETAHGVLSFIGFRMDVDEDLAKSTLDVLGVLERNDWQGRSSVQFRLVDFKKNKIPLPHAGEGD